MITELDPRSECHARALGAMNLSADGISIEKLIKARQKAIRRVKTAVRTRAREIAADVANGRISRSELASAVDELRPLLIYGLPVQEEISRLLNNRHDAFAHAIASNEKTVRKSHFVTDRGLAEYRFFLGPGFFRRLKALGPQDHWMDIGAGSANAMNDYFHYAQKGLLPMPRMTAVTISAAPIKRRSLFRSRKFRYWAGRPFEEYPDRELGHADLLTDLFGATTYSLRFDVVLEKMARRLKPEGIAYFSIKTAKLVIRAGSGKRIKVKDWLGAIKGIRIIEARRYYHFLENSLLRVAFQRTTAPLETPPLELVALEHNDASPSPRRTYRCG